MQGKLPTLRAVPFGQFRGRGLLGCEVALHIICGVLHRTYLPALKEWGTCYILVQCVLPTLSIVPCDQFRGRGLFGCEVALHIICGNVRTCLEGVGHVLHTCARQAANTEGCALWPVQGPRTSRRRSGFTHNMRCARRVNERFTVTPCSEKVVITTNDVSPRQRAFHSNTV